MMAVFTPWWNDRTPRERVLLAIMAMLLAAVLIWLLVLRPLAVAREQAIIDASAAAVRRTEAQNLVAAIRARPAANGAPVLDTLTRRLAEAGLQPSRLEAQGPGQAVLEIAAVNGRLLLGWASGLEAIDGLVIDQLEANRNRDQSVRVRMTVRRAQ
ncbi:type II secretion system protein GspM [Sandarakinorhabdus sp.]|uniref:type II secretion system protein GspM n=1 Tax=Sandarakinorhabdus sp. TaxID=1916663 RepID=UPI003F6FE8E3